MKKVVFLLGMILASLGSVFCMNKYKLDTSDKYKVKEEVVEYFVIKSRDERDRLVVSAIKESLFECFGGTLYRIVEPKDWYNKCFYVADEGSNVKLIKLDSGYAKQYLGAKIPINQNKIIKEQIERNKKK